MAPSKSHSQWQCTKSACSLTNIDRNIKPKLSLSAPLDNYGHVAVQIQHKHLNALIDSGASILVLVNTH